MSDLDTRAEAVQDILLSIFLTTIQSVDLPRPVGEESPLRLAFLSQAPTRKIILEFLLDVLLSDIQSYSAPTGPISGQEGPPAPKKHLGMSSRAIKWLNSLAAAKTYQELNDQKVAVLRFLDNHVTRSETVRHSIVR